MNITPRVKETVELIIERKMQYLTIIYACLKISALVAVTMLELRDPPP